MLIIPLKCSTPLSIIPTFISLNPSSPFVAPSSTLPASPRGLRGAPLCVTPRARPPTMAVSPLAEPCAKRDYHGIPHPLPGERLQLSDLRERLIRQEETIIFALIERAQFLMNDVIYKADAIELPVRGVSFSEFLLNELEKPYALVRRYTSPDEHPFSDIRSLPPPVLAPLDYPGTVVKNSINVNPIVQKTYVREMLPLICEGGDDQNYGSSATCDVACLQALSKRIHYGKFVAEAKYANDVAVYTRLARMRDRQGLWDELSDALVEKKLLRRVENKARTYGREVTESGNGNSFKVRPGTIRRIYRDYIIPLTKEVEIEYLLHRVNGARF